MKSGLPAVLRSRRVALALLMSTAAIAVLGTLPSSVGMQAQLVRLPGALAVARAVGLVDTYRSPLFLALAAALCASVVLCTWDRALARRGAGVGEPSVRRAGERRVLDVIVHLSLLAIVAGGVAKGHLGFVRTRNIHVGQSADAFYDFGLDADVPLGFTLEVLERVDTYYPIRALVGISDRASGRKIDLVEAREGRAVEVPGTGLSLEVAAPDEERKTLRLRTTIDGRVGAAELAMAAEGKSNTADVGGLRLALVAWRRELKGVRTRLACRENGILMREGWVSPQNRLIAAA